MGDTKHVREPILNLGRPQDRIVIQTRFLLGSPETIDLF